MWDNFAFVFYKRQKTPSICNTIKLHSAIKKNVILFVLLSICIIFVP